MEWRYQIVRLSLNVNDLVKIRSMYDIYTIGKKSLISSINIYRYLDEYYEPIQTSIKDLDHDLFPSLIPIYIQKATSGR